MIIHLPEDVENSLNEAVTSGRFASMDAAMTEAARLLLQKLKQGQAEANTPTLTEATADPVLGSMRDYAQEMDEIVADAMKQRREEPWRVIPGE